MSSGRSYNVECQGKIYRIPVQNEYNTVLQFTKEVKRRFEFPPDIHVELFYDNGHLNENDCLYELNLDTSKTPIRVRGPKPNPNVQVMNFFINQCNLYPPFSYN